MKEFIKNEQVLNLVKKAMSTGFITYSEINNELPENFPADKISEMIEEMAVNFKWVFFMNHTVT